MIMHRNAVKQNNPSNGSVIKYVSPHNILVADSILVV